MKTPNHNFRKRVKAASRRGLSLIETAMVLAVVSLLLVFFVSMTQTETDRLRAKNTADKLSTIGNAAKAYMSSNYASLLASAPAVGSGAQVIRVGRTTSGGAVPANSIQAKGFLPPSFIDANSYQQNTALLVRKVNAKTLEAMLTTYGGQDIPDRQLGNMANLIGPEGGYVPARYTTAADNGDVIGVGGGWRTQANQWGAAATRPSVGNLQMTMMFEDGELLKDYLYRNDVGVAEANRMNTAIDMNANRLNNTGGITGTAVAGKGNTVVIGAAGNDNSLQVTRDIFANRNIDSGNSITAKSNIVAGNVVQGKIMQSRRDASGGGYITADTDISAGGNIWAEGTVTGQVDVKAGRDLTSGRNLWVGGRADVMGNADIKGDLTANRIGIDAEVFGNDVDGGGARQFGGAAVTLGDLLPRMVAQYSYVVQDGGFIAKPTCRGGYSRARVMVYRQVDSFKVKPNIPLNVTQATAEGLTFVGGVDVDKANSWVQSGSGIIATNSPGNTWKIGWVGDPKADNTQRQAIAQTFCYYGKA